MSLRKVLLDAGLKPRDLREAVKNARQTAQNVAIGARIAEDFFIRAEEQVTGKTTHAAVVLAGKAARVVREVAEETLRVRKR